MRLELSKLEARLPVAVRRNDALVAAIDQKIETVSARLRDLSIPLLLRPGASSFRADFVYRRLEDGLRGSPDEIRKSLEPYLEYAAEKPPVIDAGCGRGEFLELCRERGIPAHGFDTNERSVAELRQRGFDADLGRLPDCLTALDEGSVGSILAAHVVEHLPSELLVETFAAAARALRVGGYLMIETPNAGSMVMSASDFWRDPTHLAPRHVGALTLIGREFGFEVAEVKTVAPFPEGNEIAVPDGSKELKDVVARLNEILFGDQNLRLVLRKE
jgi:O-antigen chain-terminating methyltransferase